MSKLLDSLGYSVQFGDGSILLGLPLRAYEPMNATIIREEDIMCQSTKPLTEEDLRQAAINYLHRTFTRTDNLIESNSNPAIINAALTIINREPDKKPKKGR